MKLVLASKNQKKLKEMNEILSQLAREGITVVIATHNAAQAYRWADRVVILHNGCIQAQGTPEQIFGAPKNPRLQDFLAKVL